MNVPVYFVSQHAKGEIVCIWITSPFAVGKGPCH